VHRSIRPFQEKIRTSRGASVTEYAVLMALLAVIILGSVFAMGGGVRDTLAWLNGSVRENVPWYEGAASTPLASQPLASEPREGDPLVMTFSGVARFQMYRLYNEPSNAAFPNPRIDWGPTGAHCDPTLHGMDNPNYYDINYLRINWPTLDPHYTCDLGAGTHQVRVYAPLHVLSGFDTSLVAIEDWGDTNLFSLDRAFRNATNLVRLPSNLPESIYTLNFLFSRATNGTDPTDYSKPIFSGPVPPPPPAQIADWDVSKVTVLSGIFFGNPHPIPSLAKWQVTAGMQFVQMFGYSTFNQSLAHWDMSGATRLDGMFHGNAVFNQPLGMWNTETVTVMSDMFRNATAFNQDIGNWNTGSLVNTYYMFDGATSFNQDLSRWNMQSLVTAPGMFLDATAFTGDVSAWDVPRLTSMSEMFKNSKVTGNYGRWRPMLTNKVANEVFRNSRASGDLRCWDASRYTPTGTPSYFSNGSLISHNPLWKQPRPGTCTP